MIQVGLTNGKGRAVHLDEEGNLQVVVHPHPPINETVAGQPVPFRQRFTDDGTASGSSNMIVNGSTTNVDFYISAIQDYDIYIKTMSVIISDATATATLATFGSLSALTNGVQWLHITSDRGEYELHDGIKTNLEFVRLGTRSPAVGGGTTAFQADVSGAGETSYLPLINLEDTFGVPWGLRLRKGTTDKIVFRVRDNLTGLDQFNIIGYGIRW